VPLGRLAVRSSDVLRCLPAADPDGLEGNIGAILRSYRRAGGLTQQQLADLLGFDRTYISMIERGRRSITDRGTLRHISRTLAIPPHVLGITGSDDADFAAMLSFGASVIRLANIARHGGHAAEAVSELWPLITRLETRVASGHAEPEAVRLLVQARVSFGVALGHLLPEEQMATAARWTGRALRLAWNFGDHSLLASVLRMHGNELRKAGHTAAAMTRLRQSLQLNDHPGHRGAALVLLARAAAESGQAELFDTVTGQCVQALKTDEGHEVFFNAFTVREVRIRGLLATGRTGEAVDLAEGLRPAKVRLLRNGVSSSASPPRMCSPGWETSEARLACCPPPSATQRRCACRIRSSESSA
jgi:transcriptional regulator with XRE-family HTH domain